LFHGLFPFSKFNPFFRVWFVNGNDLDQRAAWVTALNMKRALGGGYAKYQATGTVFIVGIIFNDLTVIDCFSYLAYAISRNSI
jgi:hypothetical protein